MQRIFSNNNARKGSLSLSINAIVVLILAITLLGLGLAFIRNLFGGAVGKLEEIYAGLSEEDKKALASSQEEITFLSSDVKITGRELNVPFAIRNIRPDRITLRVKHNFYCFDAINVPKAPGSPGATPSNQLSNNVINSAYVDANGVKTADIEKTLKATTISVPIQPSSSWISFQTFDTRDIDSGKSDVLPLTVRVSASAAQTTYSCAFAPAILAPRQATATALELYGSPKYFNIIFTK